MDDDLPEGDDALFGYNLRKLRERAGMSEVALADAMREHGRPWHQSTVGRVQSGQQPAKYADAVALAAIFGVPLEQFRWKTGEANAIGWLDMAAERVQAQFNETARAVAAQIAAGSLAEQALEGTVRYSTPRALEARQILEDVMEEYCPIDAAVDAGIQMYQSMHDDEEGETDGDTESEPGIVDQQRA
jgi:transcriptional regulator with XRE-family HTH domain